LAFFPWTSYISPSGRIKKTPFFPHPSLIPHRHLCNHIPP
jgi:hypothetical protein